MLLVIHCYYINLLGIKLDNVVVVRAECVYIAFDDHELSLFFTCISLTKWLDLLKVETKIV